MAGTNARGPVEDLDAPVYRITVEHVGDEFMGTAYGVPIIVDKGDPAEIGGLGEDPDLPADPE